jgi:3-oxoacyl-[acyl-carrier-protein] synthase II
VLESAESAARRGANVLAELAGYATNNNAFHLTAPEKNGKSIARAISRALEDAGVAPGEVDYVNAHGTATRYNDSTETMAIKEVLAERAGQIPVNSIKSMIGHLMGAASAAEAVATIKTLQTGIVPPTIHYETPDPECDLDCVPNVAREYPVRVALNNSSGLGGANSMVVFRKADRA